MSLKILNSWFEQENLMVEPEVLVLVSIGVAIGLFLLGFFIGKDSDKKTIANMKQAIVDAHNVDRILDGRDKDDEKHFVEDGKIKGSKTVLFSFSLKGDMIDFENKKKITEDGVIDLSDEEIKELRKLPQFRKMPI